MLLPLLASFRDCSLFWAESGRIHGIHRLSLFNSFSSFPNHLMLYKAKGRIYCLQLSHSMGWETEKGAQGEREWEASAGEGYAESAPASPFSPLSPASCPLPRHSSRAQVLFCVFFKFLLWPKHNWYCLLFKFCLFYLQLRAMFRLSQFEITW